MSFSTSATAAVDSAILDAIEGQAPETEGDSYGEFSTAALAGGGRRRGLRP